MCLSCSTFKDENVKEKNYDNDVQSEGKTRCFLNGVVMHQGCVGDDLSLDDGIAAAQACALNILAQVNDAVDEDWSKVKRCVKLGGFVNSTPDFIDQPRVINGASDLIGAAMGEAGKHSRFAVSAPSLPLGVAVEIDAVFELAH